MTKRLLSFALTLVVVFGTCLASFPSLSAFASFKTGDVITITGKEGGGVFYAGGYYGGPGADIPPYFVSAMNATDRTNTANYFVWCASYGVTD